MIGSLAWSVMGCAVGDFISGAPSQQQQRVASNALLERRCNSCHATPDPGSMTGAQWQAALTRMKRRIQLPASEWDSLATMASRN